MRVLTITSLIWLILSTNVCPRQYRPELFRSYTRRKLDPQPAAARWFK